MVVTIIVVVFPRPRPSGDLFPIQSDHNCRIFPTDISWKSESETGSFQQQQQQQQQQLQQQQQ